MKDANLNKSMTILFESGIQTGSVSDRGEGSQVEERLLSGLGDEWLGQLNCQGYNARGENNIQFSRVIAGATWPPVATWSSLGYISANRPLVFDPFAEEDNHERHPPLAINDVDTERSGSPPGSPSSITFRQLGSVSRSTVDSSFDVMETRTTYKKERNRNRMKALAPRELNQEDWKEESPAEVVAVNNVDRFLSRATPVTLCWEKPK
ncbi:hypothetical protein BT96DRAFT_1098595 [Gymnopus androsaceus JB14]|uniref:Uncharacterized protein n=1 Tax=Gymnopus androsaceus JB14 TaxID=1447944 RepID=A0A6A4HP63_9AGAR|nr:hypothetical protein BT96DRAFT_1098595 [Gymnopus androsaceus JB14]